MPIPDSNRIYSYSSLEEWGEDGIKVGLFGPRGLRDDDREGKAIIDLAKKVIKRDKFKLNEKAFDSLYISIKALYSFPEGVASGSGRGQGGLPILSSKPKPEVVGYAITITLSRLFFHGASSRVCMGFRLAEVMLISQEVNHAITNA